MKTWRQKYFEDYEAEKIYTDNRKGYKIVYTYVGKWFRWNEEGGILKRRKYVYVALAAMMTLLLLLCGTAQTAINTSPLVAVPGVVAVAALLYCWIGLIQFLLTKERMHERDCRQIHSTLEISAKVLAICFSLCFAFGLYVWIRQGLGAAALWPLVGYALCLVAAWSLCRLHGRLSFSPVEDDKVILDEMPFE